MTAGTSSKKNADKLIHWIRHYAPLHIDSHLADKRCCFPPQVLADLADQGFFGIHITQKHGGLELKTSDILRVIEQVAAIDLTLSIILIEAIQGAHTLEKYASESMKDQYLNLLASGLVFTAGAMTESDAGSNPRAMKSIAVPDNENGWLLKGSKHWVGMGASAHIIAIYVQQLDSNNNWLGISGFLVPSGTEGLCIGQDFPTLGVRGFSKNTITMDNTPVSSEHLLGKVGEGMEIAQDNMMYIRLCLAAASVGAMKRCAQLMYQYAEHRVIATGLLLENPVTLIRLSEITAVIDAIDNFIYLISSIYDENPSSVPEEAFLVSKILGSEYLGWVADLAVQLLGAKGYEDASDVAKIFRDARVFRIFEGPTEALNMYIGSRGLEQNISLENFIGNTLNQKKLLNDMTRYVAEIKECCLINKSRLFSKPFSINYWAQALVGDVIIYGLFLAGIEYSLQKDNSEVLQRACVWGRSKYDEVIQKVTAFSLGEKVVAHQDDLERFISSYANEIGCIDPCYSFIHNEKRDNKQGDKPTNLETDVFYPALCVYHLFEQQVIKNPKSIALVYHDHCLSYEALNAQANKVAHSLKKEGIGRNKLVAMYFERSLEMIIGLLGVMKAEGAYLPLDYKYPENNLKFMLEDSGADLILSQKKRSQSFPFVSKKTVFIEDILQKNTPEFEGNITTNININNLAYIIYTSGSTGQPKGVMMPHKALTNLMAWHNGKVQEKRHVLQFTTLNFDMSVIEIFSALGSGGTLTIISDDDRLDLMNFSNILKKQAIEQLILSVPFLKNLAEANIEKNYFSSLKEIIIAGEQLIITPSIRSFFTALRSCKLLNYYGPTETHVVTAYEFPQRTEDWPEYPPIGQPIPNVTIEILDDNKQEVSIGFVGEIYIGGVCLATGYKNREELTREKFITDKTNVLYRSGDRAKYLADGNLLFLGRKDEQLKVRGYRMEPQEIEYHLLKYPGIQEAIVMAKKNYYEDNQLEAFIVIGDQINEDFREDIHTFLQGRLPAHMHPSVFHIIDSMPLTNSGKVDRKALEKYDAFIRYEMTNIVEPTTHTEKVIIEIMEEIFKIRIGINNSFISIGGNSLLAMQIISKLRDKFLMDIPLYSLLSKPTIADTAKCIDALLSTT